MSVKFSNDEGQDAIKAVRADSDPTTWVVFEYKGKAEVGFLAKGEGSLGQLKSNLDDNEIFYALYRAEDVVDGNATVKFVWIVFIGEKVKVFKKAMTATHRGAVAEYIGQAHVTIDVSSINELSTEFLMSKVTDASGTSIRTLNKDKQRNTGNREVKTKTTVNQGKLEFKDTDGIKNAFKDVRNDDKDTTWALIGYEGEQNVITLRGSGSNLEDMKNLLEDDLIAYGLVRVATQIDTHDVVRFVLVVFIGSAIGGVRRAKIVTHKGIVIEYIGQYHVDVEAFSKDEISSEILQEEVERTAGIRSNVVEKKEEEVVTNNNNNNNTVVKKKGGFSASLVSNPKKGNAVNVSGVGMKFENEDECLDAVKAVRSDKDETDFALFSYATNKGNDKTIVLVATGTGGTDAAKAKITDPAGGCYYAYIRVNTIVDTHPTVKFVFITYLGESIRVVRKAKIATHKGGVKEFLGQYHVDQVYATLDEMSTQSVADAVDEATFEQKRN